LGTDLVDSTTGSQAAVSQLSELAVDMSGVAFLLLYAYLLWDALAVFAPWIRGRGKK
jgi:hypothetical protein